MSFGRHLILDSCVVLTDVFRSQKFGAAVEKMKRDSTKAKIPLLITVSVFEECETRVNGLMILLAKIVDELWDYMIEVHKDQPSESRPMSQADIQEIGNFFEDAKRRYHDNVTTRDQVAAYEVLIVDFLEEKLTSRESLSQKEFFNNCMVQVQRLQHTLDGQLLTYSSNRLTYPIDNSSVQALHFKLPKIKPSDLRILLEANEHKKTHPKTIFISLDDHDIILEAKRIESEIGLRCATPVYAVNTVTQI